MTTTWILTANASEAHLYSVPRAKLFNGKANLAVEREFTNPDSRKKSGDLIAGKSGKFHQSKAGYGTFVESSQAKKLESERFARQLARELELARNDNRFQDLILIAPPSFHGQLNKYMKKAAVNDLISVDVEKDYTKMKPQYLVEALQGFI